MLKRNIKAFSLLFVCVVSVILIGCSQFTAETISTVPYSPTETATATATRLPTTTPVQPTQTSTRESIDTSLVTPIQTQTATIQPTLLVTPLPTIPTEEAEKFALNLLGANKNCRYPCWWEMYPGQTTYQEVHSFLSTFAQNIHSQGDVESGMAIIESVINLPKNKTPYPHNSRLFFVFEDGILMKVRTFLGDPIAISPTQIMHEYGQPDEIWISTMAYQQETLPFRIILLFLDQNFGVIYGTDAEINDGLITACFENIESKNMGISVWSPDAEDSLYRAQPFFDESQQYKPLEKATTLNSSELFEIFTDPSLAPCLQTSVDIWE